MEGHYHTYNKNGTVNTGWHILAWPNKKGNGNAFAITIPHVLSLLETHTWNGKVKGMDSIKPQNRPPVIVPFYAFRVMVAAGVSMLFMALWAGWLMFRRRFTLDALKNNRLFLRVIVGSAFLPYIAVWTGWWTREVGRQPWVVFGMMRTSAGVSHMSVAQEIFWLVGYMSFEVSVLAGTWYFLAKEINKGPDMVTPVVQEGAHSLGHLEDPADRQTGQPTYLRPI